MALARNFMSGPRVWPGRNMGFLPANTNMFNLAKAATVFPSASDILGNENRAWFVSGTGNSTYRLLAGCQMGDLAGGNMTITVTIGGSLSVTSSGLNVTLNLAAGGSTPASIVAAVLAAFPAVSGLPCNPYLTADIPTGTGATLNSTTFTKRFFNQDQRFPGGPI